MLRNYQIRTNRFSITDILGSAFLCTQISFTVVCVYGKAISQLKSHTFAIQPQDTSKPYKLHTQKRQFKPKAGKTSLCMHRKWVDVEGTVDPGSLPCISTAPISSIVGTPSLFSIPSQVKGLESGQGMIIKKAQVGIWCFQTYSQVFESL